MYIHNKNTILNQIRAPLSFSRPSIMVQLNYEYNEFTARNQISNEIKYTLTPHSMLTFYVNT